MNIFDRVIDGNTLRTLHEGKEKTFTVNMTLTTPDHSVNEGAIVDILRLLIGGKYEIEVKDMDVMEEPTNESVVTTDPDTETLPDTETVPDTERKPHRSPLLPVPGQDPEPKGVGDVRNFIKRRMERV